MGLLIHWTTTGHPHYASMEDSQTIAYISDVGAQSLKPLFIAGSVVTTIFLDASFLSERWLRHQGRLVRNTTQTEKVLSGLSLGFALIGTVGLICLSIFDTLRHPTLHDLFLLLFIAGYVISAIFICWEYQRLGIRTSLCLTNTRQPQYKAPKQRTNTNNHRDTIDFRQHRILRNSFWVKLTFILIEIVLAIAFGVCNFRNQYNAAGILEWAIAFIFTFYVFSFFIDLIPAVHTVRGQHNAAWQGGETEMQREANDGVEGIDNVRSNGYPESERTVGRNEVGVVGGGKERAVANNF